MFPRKPDMKLQTALVRVERSQGVGLFYFVVVSQLLRLLPSHKASVEPA